MPFLSEIVQPVCASYMTLYNLYALPVTQPAVSKWHLHRRLTWVIWLLNCQV